MFTRENEQENVSQGTEQSVELKQELYEPVRSRPVFDTPRAEEDVAMYSPATGRTVFSGYKGVRQQEIVKQGKVVNCSVR